MTPLTTTGGLRFESRSGKYFAASPVSVVGDQERVATTRGEQPTDGYVRVDTRGG